MKKIYIIGFILCVAAVSAQTNGGKGEDLNCYNKWAQKFDERGAEDVNDGIYDDIIITVRQGSKADCYNGKVVVKDKKVVMISMLREDGTYDELKWKWKNDSKNITVANGISTSLITSDNKLVNILWPKKIKPKKAPFKRAPEPEDD